MEIQIYLLFIGVKSLFSQVRYGNKMEEYGTLMPRGQEQYSQ
jgi:hypothetical protein